MRIRDAAAASVYNSLIIDFANGAIVADDDFDGDSYDRLVAGDMEFSNNVFYTFGDGDEFEQIMDTDGADPTVLLNILEANECVIADPIIGGISREADGGLDPRTSSYLTNFQAAFSLEDDFFDDVDYIGAFSNSTNWAKGLTALDEYGYFGDLVLVGLEETEISELTIFPNPTNGLTQISFENETDSNVTIQVRNILGQLISSNKISATSGKTNLSVDLTSAQSGTYLVSISSGNGTTSTRKIIKK